MVAGSSPVDVAQRPRDCKGFAAFFVSWLFSSLFGASFLSFYFALLTSLLGAILGAILDGVVRILNERLFSSGAKEARRRRRR